MKPRLVSIGLATPAHSISQDGSADLARLMAPAHVSGDVVAKITRRTGIRSRGSMLLDADACQTFYRTPRDADDRGPSTGERLVNATRDAAVLGSQAAQRALDEAPAAASSITHLITASCTTLEAPGFDQGIISALGLSRDVRRTHVGFMGCHAAINALAMARAIAASDAHATVLVVCVELCSLHMHYSDRTDQLIANALFADGAAAAVVRQEASEAPHLAALGSRIFADAAGASTADAMAWSVSDHGFAMTLDKRVPDLLRGGVPEWIDGVVARAGCTREQVGAWAIHPGGPRIVQTILEALALKDEVRLQGEADAMSVLEAHGNMSSATVLFILKRLMERGAPRPWAAMAFGPGLAGEAVVLG